METDIEDSHGASHADEQEEVSTLATWRSRLRSPNFLLYYSHVMATWGDRMWQYATGMFLIAISPDSLRLTAIYGFSSGGAILLLGAIIGKWVDNKSRLTVASCSLVIQNVCVWASASVVCLMAYFQGEVSQGLVIPCYVAVIVFAVLADLGSIARQISIERDWIVAMCDDTKSLTEMSALLRRIDLTAKVLAPAATGVLLTSTSIATGALVIAAWNVTSVFIEYALLSRTYYMVPKLAARKTDKSGGRWAMNESAPLLSRSKTRAKYGYVNQSDDDEQNNVVFLAKVRPLGGTTAATPGDQRAKSFCSLLCASFVTLIHGWETYFNQSVLLAGLSLAFLYMTVLGFDNVTAGYAKSEGLNEATIGAILGGGAILGIAGTLLFPRLRQRYGLHRTGLLAFGVDICCLALCVGSIFAPGSPFQPFVPEASFPIWSINNVTNNASSTVTASGLEPSKPWTSIVLLMTGIVLSRIALWVIDLTVTQMLIEYPDETVRGTVNGVQKSMNSLMEQLKFLFVVALPWTQTFGVLVLASFFFVVTGGCLFAAHAHKTSGTNERDNNRFSSDGASCG